jgi:hypothetical protein
MSWFSRSRKETAPAVAQMEGGPEVHRSLGLAALLEGMRRRGQGLRILDLGSAVGANVEYLSQLGCKLHIGDLYASRTSAGEGELSLEFFEQLFPSDARLDVVLAWDLFNYLQRKELIRLGTLLRRHCQPGALVFALMSFQKQIPAQPYRFRIQGDNQLVYEQRTSLERPGPRYAPSEMASAMKGFRVDRSFLLRHGIQEYLFSREGEEEETRAI